MQANQSDFENEKFPWENEFCNLWCALLAILMIGGIKKNEGLVLFIGQRLILIRILNLKFKLWMDLTQAM